MTRGFRPVLRAARTAFHAGSADKHIEQAENYASRAGVPWAVLTNGIDWRLYHLTFAESEGITHEVAFSMNLPEDLAADPETGWSKLSLLRPESVSQGALDAFWARRKALRPASVVRGLFARDVLGRIRRELNRDAPARLDLQDVFNAVRDVISKEALAEAGDLRVGRRKARRGAPEKPGGRPRTVRGGRAGQPPPARPIGRRTHHGAAGRLAAPKGFDRAATVPAPRDTAAMNCSWCSKPMQYVHGHAACVDGRCPMYGMNQAECCGGETGGQCPAATAGRGVA